MVVAGGSLGLPGAMCVDFSLRNLNRFATFSRDYAQTSTYNGVASLTHFKRGRTQAEEPIFQFAIIPGVYARPGTLYTHKTVARFAQGLADLYY